MVKTCDEVDDFMPTPKFDFSFWIKSFHEKVKTGPFYVFVICNCCLYYSNVVKFDSKKKNTIQNSWTN